MLVFARGVGGARLSTRVTFDGVPAMAVVALGSGWWSPHRRGSSGLQFEMPSGPVILGKGFSSEANEELARSIRSTV